ncbi:unnamed protein product [marine sediment metagenome]|uniref:Uncharacterized protein n=1 Tax=marine sediment metagenome TaxID=412755 RepID=X1FWV6_9ZZZZ
MAADKPIFNVNRTKLPRARSSYIMQRWYRGFTWRYRGYKGGDIKILCGIF